MAKLIPIRLETAIDQFINDLEYRSRSPRTREFYEKNLLRLSARYPLVELHELGVDEIRDFFRSRDLSKSHAIHADYRTFRAFFNWCLSQEYILESPMDHFQAPGLPEKIKPTLTPQEIRRMLATQSRQTFLGRRNRLLVALLWDTGIRASELVALQLDDVDLKHRAIRVQRGKGAKERIVQFSEKTAKMMRLYLGMDTHPKDRAVHRGASEALFLSEERRPLTYQGVYDALTTMGELAGMTKQCSPHVFRHTWARMTLASGVDSRYVQTLGGWSSLEMVGQYTKDQARDDALAAQRAHLLVDRFL